MKGRHKKGDLEIGETHGSREEKTSREGAQKVGQFGSGDDTKKLML